MDQAPQKFTDTIRTSPFQIPRASASADHHIITAGMLKAIDDCTKKTTSGLMIDW